MVKHDPQGHGEKLEHPPLTLSTFGWKVAVIVSAFSAALLFSVGMVQEGGDAYFMAIGLLCFACASVPLLTKRSFYVFEPIVLIAATVLVGGVFGSIFIATASEYNYKLQFLTDGVTSAQMSHKAIWVPVALLCLSFGYILAQNYRFPVGRLRIFRAQNWKRGRILALSFIAAIVSIFGILELARTTGVDFTGYQQLSAKRAVETDSGNFASLGYLRWVVDLAKIALLIVVAERLQSGRTRSGAPVLVKALYGIVVVGLLLLSVVWPIVSSSRTGILETAFSMFILLTYLGFKGSFASQRRKFIGMALIGLAFALSVLAAMGVWRQMAQGSDVRDSGFASALVNNSVASGNFFPLDRTAIIIDRMEGRDDWMLGSSFANIFVAPVPRAIWPEKPEISLGLYVKEELYGRPTYKSGYPPGLLGEAFINFGYMGLLVVPLIAGFALRVLFNSFNDMMLNRNKNAVVLYSVILWPLGFQLVALDFTLTIINVGMAVIPTGLLLYLVSSSRRSGQVPIFASSAH